MAHSVARGGRERILIWSLFLYLKIGCLVLGGNFLFCFGVLFFFIAEVLHLMSIQTGCEDRLCYCV